jgi:hypothetical protein
LVAFQAEVVNSIVEGPDDEILNTLHSFYRRHGSSRGSEVDLHRPFRKGAVPHETQGMDRRTDESHCLKRSTEFAVRDYNLSLGNDNTSFVFPGIDDRMQSSGRHLLPELVVLPFAGSGSMLVNFACALMLAASASTVA